MNVRIPRFGQQVSPQVPRIIASPPKNNEKNIVSKFDEKRKETKKTQPKKKIKKILY